MDSSQQQFERLFDYARSVTPYLDGFIEQNPDHHLRDATDPQSLQVLYSQLANNHPEAGQAYWLTRTWDLLCWQPIFISFIAIYCQKSLPDLTRMTQYQKECFITGFSFEPHSWISARRETLIQKAAEQLNQLFERYRTAINQWGRIRPGFTNHLLADHLLNCLIRLQKARPAYSNQMIIDQAKYWLSAFDLPEKHLDSLKFDQQTQRLTLVRTSCCLVYKCDGRAVCANCPRLSTNKHKQPISA